MATRYQKRRCIFPGIRLNQNGPLKVSSVTFGRPGFISYTLAGKGKKHLNIDLPGGYSYRKDFGKKKADEAAQEAKAQAKAEQKAAKEAVARGEQPAGAVVVIAKPNLVMFGSTLALGLSLGGWLF